MRFHEGFGVFLRFRLTHHTISMLRYYADFALSTVVYCPDAECAPPDLRAREQPGSSQALLEAPAAAPWAGMTRDTCRLRVFFASAWLMDAVVWRHVFMTTARLYS
jgi:hypothetical protein